MIKVDTSQAQKKAKRAQKTLAEIMQQQGSLAARVHAFHNHQYTQPVSAKSDWPFGRMEKQIERDVRNAYPTKEDDNWQNKAFRVIGRELGEEPANRFWRAYKADTRQSGEDEDGDPSTHERIFDRLKGIKSTNLDKYQAWRRAKNGPLAVVAAGKRRAFLNQRQKTKGLAKAGWYAAHRLLGGRGTAVTRSSDGNAANVRKYSKQIAVPFRTFGGTSLARVRVGASRNGFTYSINNRVRHSSEAFLDHKAIPERLAERYMKIHITHTLKRKRRLWKEAA